MDDLYAFWLIIRGGITHIHPIPFVIIALLCGLVTRGAPAVVLMALFGTAIYVLTNAVLPTMTAGQGFAMPHLNHAFWYSFMSVAIAMVVVIGFIYGLKTAVSNIRE
jgi:hypothetical protein